jgi:hypothetical protein
MLKPPQTERYRLQIELAPEGEIVATDDRDTSAMRDLQKQGQRHTSRPLVVPWGA